MQNVAIACLRMTDGNPNYIHAGCRTLKLID